MTRYPRKYPERADEDAERLKLFKAWLEANYISNSYAWQAMGVVKTLQKRGIRTERELLAATVDKAETTRRLYCTYWRKYAQFLKEKFNLIEYHAAFPWDVHRWVAGWIAMDAPGQSLQLLSRLKWCDVAREDPSGPIEVRDQAASFKAGHEIWLTPDSTGRNSLVALAGMFGPPEDGMEEYPVVPCAFGSKDHASVAELESLVAWNGPEIGSWPYPYIFIAQTYPLQASSTVRRILGRHWAPPTAYCIAKWEYYKRFPFKGFGPELEPVPFHKTPEAKNFLTDELCFPVQYVPWEEDLPYPIPLPGCIEELDINLGKRLRRQSSQNRPVPPEV